MGIVTYKNTIYMSISWFTTGRICLHYYVAFGVLCMINYIWAALARLSALTIQCGSLYASVEILPPDVTTFGWLGVIFHSIKNSQSPNVMKILRICMTLVVRGFAGCASYIYARFVVSTTLNLELSWVHV